MRPPPGRDDAAIRAALEERLAPEGSLEDSAIEVVSVQEGVVRLGGRAASQADLHRALEIAHGAEGVRSLRSEVAAPLRYAEDPLAIELEEARRLLEGRAAEAPAGGERPGPAPAARDAWLSTAVKLRLHASEGLPADRCAWTRATGGSSSEGRSRRRATSSAAASAARRVEGVRAVETDALRVRGEEGAG